MTALDSSLGQTFDGMLSQFAVLDAQGVVNIPEHLTDEEAATLPCAALTAWYSLVTRGHLCAGDAVLIQRTGRSRALPCSFQAVRRAPSYSRVVSPKLSERALSVRTAQSTIPASRLAQVCFGLDRRPRLRSRARARRPRDVCSVTAGGSHRWTSERHRLSCRQASGNQSAPDSSAAVVRGIPVGHRESFETMNRAIGLHQLRPVIDRVFNWTQIGDAFQYVKSRQHFGKVVVGIN